MIQHKRLKVGQDVVKKLRLDFHMITIDIDDIYKKTWLKSRIVETLQDKNSSYDEKLLKDFVELMYIKKGNI